LKKEFEDREEAGVKHYEPKGKNHATPVEFLKNCAKKKELGDGFDRDVVMKIDKAMSDTDDKLLASDFESDQGP